MCPLAAPGHLDGGHGNGPEQQPHHADGAPDEAALQDGVQRQLHVLPDDGLRLGYAEPKPIFGALKISDTMGGMVAKVIGESLVLVLG